MLWLFLSLFHYALTLDGWDDWPLVLKQCSRTKNGDWTKNDGQRCYIVNNKLNFLKIEVLSTKPIILRYHQLIHRRHCKRLLGDVKQMNLEMAGVQSSESTAIAYKGNRKANSSWVDHLKLPNFRRFFNTLQRAIPVLDLSRSEQFQVLSYHKDGHYAPHYDYLNPDSDPTCHTHGNRISTVFTILQAAKKGGTDVNVRPNLGDTLVWQNMEVDGERDYDSLHAACPVTDGVKIGATLWVRSFGQELKLRCDNEREWSVDPFLKL